MPEADEVIARYRGKSNKPVPRKFPRVWIDKATADIQATYIVKGLFRRGDVVVVYGPSGDGKTFCMADLSGHIAAGIPWRGRRVHGGLVVYVAAEAGASILRRFFAWREHHMGEAREKRIPLSIITCGINLLNPVDVEALIAELRAIVAEICLPLALVVFDTLSRSIPGGDENKAEDMTCVIQAADLIRDELGAATAIVHHTGKDSSKGARGHSALCAAADTVISVMDRVATIEKSRDGTSGEQFPFELDVVDFGTDADGDPVTTCVVRPLEHAATRRQVPALSGVAKVALQALHEAVVEHGKTIPGSSTIPEGVRAVRLEQWRSQFKLRYGSDQDGDRQVGAVRTAFHRARDQLAKADAIGISDPWVWGTR